MQAALYQLESVSKAEAETHVGPIIDAIMQKCPKALQAAVLSCKDLDLVRPGAAAPAVDINKLLPRMDVLEALQLKYKERISGNGYHRIALQMNTHARDHGHKGVVPTKYAMGKKTDELEAKYFLRDKDFDKVEGLTCAFRTHILEVLALRAQSMAAKNPEAFMQHYVRGGNKLIACFSLDGFKLYFFGNKHKPGEQVSSTGFVAASSVPRCCALCSVFALFVYVCVCVFGSCSHVCLRI